MGDGGGRGKKKGEEGKGEWIIGNGNNNQRIDPIPCRNTCSNQILVSKEAQPYQEFYEEKIW